MTTYATGMVVTGADQIAPELGIAIRKPCGCTAGPIWVVINAAGQTIYGRDVRFVYPEIFREMAAQQRRRMFNGSCLSGFHPKGPETY